MKNRQNTFVALLDLLKVKHTNDFSNGYFNEHPHKYNLFGLSKMLSDYGVENAAIKIADKEKDIAEIKTPFIAHFGGDFVVVDKVDAIPQSLNPSILQSLNPSVHFIWKGNDHVLPISEFSEAWTGIVLLAESSEKSIEPDYKEHKKKDRLNFLKKAALFSFCSLILLLTYIHQAMQILLFVLEIPTVRCGLQFSPIPIVIHVQGCTKELKHYYKK